MVFLDVTLRPGVLWSVATRPQDTVFAYMVEGECELAGGGEIPHRNACLFTPGDSLSLVGGPEGARFVLFSGAPLHEPVAWGGPIVMNTDEELRQAFFEQIRYRHFRLSFYDSGSNEAEQVAGRYQTVGGPG
mgnify:CR=1 FL=1